MDRIYEVAYFFKISPLELFECDIHTVIEMKQQSDRLAELITNAKS